MEDRPPLQSSKSARSVRMAGVALGLCGGAINIVLAARAFQGMSDIREPIGPIGAREAVIFLAVLVTVSFAGMVSAALIPKAPRGSAFLLLTLSGLGVILTLAFVGLWAFGLLIFAPAAIVQMSGGILALAYS
jgi:hypothetical protein